MALCTASEVRAIMPQLTGTSQDSILDTMITRADTQMARWCLFPAATPGGVPTMEDTTYTRYFDGNGEGGVTLRLGIPPLVSVTTIHDDPDTRTYGAASLVAASDYDLDLELGQAILTSTSTHGAWSSRSYRSIKAVYVAGWVTVPEELKGLCAELVAHWWRLRKERGKNSVSQQGTSLSLIPETLPDRVKEGLAPYRLRDRL